MILYHWTCSHGAVGIARSGLVVPHPQPMHPLPPVAWLTDVGPDDMPPPGPARAALVASLGLQSTLLDCDRTETCWQVDTDDAVPFLSLRDRVLATGAGRDWWSALTMGRTPARWWLATIPLPAVRVA